ncbi:hypothetical protein C9374_006228 [Naegleria lovaniensis]|uniref:HNH domain-containing protein n=1 Tax=Naegleria lovaniensis TaxID=51637 RepID=A0AA88KHJ3_NAELO|nr:uncharacterized protein C9374_006228 [Naegleria lovaniensis]KAG2381844.1 hypothetical protein C9374_006228 [Naegleria lovaniensis]
MSSSNNSSSDDQTSPPSFYEISDEQLQQCVRKAIMKVLPQLIDDEDILDHVVNELINDNVNMLSQSGAIDFDDVAASAYDHIKSSATKLSFAALSNTKGEKKQQSQTLIINILSEHLINYDVSDDDEEEISQICHEIQEHFRNIRLGQYADYGVNIGDADDDDGAYVEDGCCVMCEREMKLTRHHLIPRTCHKKYLKRGQYTKEHLNKCILICRVCHDAVHSFISLDDMAEHYHTLETILSHPKVQRWIPYVSKQRTGKKFRF